MAKAIVFRCFLVVGCEDNHLRDKIGMEGITDGNMLQILGIIEQRVLQFVKNMGSKKQPVRKLRKKTYGNQIHIVPPNTVDSSDDEKPVSHEQALQELRTKASRTHRPV